MTNIYKHSMDIGHYFNTEFYNDNRTEDWCGSEECATFAKIILDYVEKNNCDVSVALYKLTEETIDGINNESIKTEDHARDDYCKGFLAGEILGLPTEDNLNKVRMAEELWKDSDKYGYYQEVLEEVV